jgi:hypothetical protein
MFTILFERLLVDAVRAYKNLEADVVYKPLELVKGSIAYIRGAIDHCDPEDRDNLLATLESAENSKKPMEAKHAIMMAEHIKKRAAAFKVVMDLIKYDGRIYRGVPVVIRSPAVRVVPGLMDNFTVEVNPTMLEKTLDRWKYIVDTKDRIKMEKAANAASKKRARELQAMRTRNWI